MKKQADGLLGMIRSLVLSVTAGAGLAMLSGCASVSPDADGERRARGKGPIAAEPVSGVQAAQPPREHQLAAALRGQNTFAGGFRPVGSGSPPGAPAPRAMSAASVEAWLLAIEQAYASGRFDQAQQLVSELLAWQPDEPRAWLREANLNHRSGDHDRAVYAYRRVVELTNALPNPEAPGPAGLRSRASTNLAILSVEQARRALESVGGAGDDPTSAIHRARVETALRVVVTGGRPMPPAEAPGVRSAHGSPPQSLRDLRSAQGTHSQSPREPGLAQGTHLQSPQEPGLARGTHLQNAPGLAGSPFIPAMTSGWIGPTGSAGTGLPGPGPSANTDPRRDTGAPVSTARGHLGVGSAEALPAAPNAAAGIEVIRGGFIR
jgi:hypothetical protein